MSRTNPASEEWEVYFRNHPEVIASWGEANGRQPNCTCKPCDPNELRSRPSILAEPTNSTR